jgi:hypothetical protein
MPEPRTTEVDGRQVYICYRCDQPILTTGVVSSGQAVHVPMCPTRKA